MRNLVRVTFDGRPFSAYPGDILLDAALRSGVGMPHDCRSGDCDACVVRVVSGRVEGGEADLPGTIRACEARAVTDLEIVTDAMPRATTEAARIETITALSDDVVEMILKPRRPIAIHPGQHLEIEFDGHPARAFWPTASLDARGGAELLHFHIKRGPGTVSQAIGRSIIPGQMARVLGPFGRQHLRRGLQNRLVLVSSGIGFARIWSIADAALRERPERSILAIVGVSSVRDLYMVQALDLMASCPNVRVLVTSEQHQSVTPVILTGRPSDYLPPLLSRDVVHAAGSSELVETVRQAAAVSGAAFHGEAFVSGNPAERPGGWLDRILLPLSGKGRAAPPVAAFGAGPENLPASELARRFRADPRQLRG